MRLFLAARLRRRRSATILAIIASAALVIGAALAIRPRSAAPWVGPAAAGHWVSTGLTVQTDKLLAGPSHGPAGSSQNPISGPLYAGTADGVWRSSDEGHHWARFGSGLRGQDVDGLASPSDGTVLFAATTGGFIYRLDTGHPGSWQIISPALGAVYSLALSPTGPHTLLAGTAGALYQGRPTADPTRWNWQVVYRTDGSSISSIVWVANAPHTVLASIFGQAPAVIESTNDGHTWQARVAGLPAELPSQSLLALPGTPSRVILTTMGAGVWENVVGGGATQQWQDISAGLPERHAMPIVAWPSSADTSSAVLYAGTMGDGVYVKQGKDSWQILGSGLSGVPNTILSLAVTAGAQPTLLAGTASGIYRYAPPTP